MTKQMNKDLLLAQLRKAKDDLSAAGERVEELQSALVGLMQASGEASLHTVTGGTAINGTLVEAVRIKVNEPKLAKALGASKWASVTKRVLDKDKLDAAMVTGAVDPTVVAAASEEVHNKPYIKITVKEVRRVRKPSEAARKTKIVSSN